MLLRKPLDKNPAVPFHCRTSAGLLMPGLIFVLLLTSCVKEKFVAEDLDPTLQINPALAVPIGWARYQVDEILRDSLDPDEMVIDEEGFISLVYRQEEVQSLQASEILSIPDVSASGLPVDNPFGMPIDLNTLPTDTTFEPEFIDLTLPPGGTTGAEMDSILIDWALMNLSVSSPYGNMHWTARFQIPGLKEWQITLDDTNPSVLDTLEDVTLPIRNTPSPNSLRLSVELTVSPSDETIATGPILQIGLDLSDLDYDLIYGYLGQFTLRLGPQSFAVDFTNRLSGGTFHFRDPQMKIRFRNSFGMPIQLDLSGLQASSGGQATYLSGPGVPGPSDHWILAYPRTGQEGLVVADSLLLTGENTNLDELPSPDEVIMDVLGSVNPDGPDHTNFVLDTSKFSFSTELKLPLDGYSDSLFIADTLDFVFAHFYSNPPQEIVKLIFRLENYNQIPVDISTQLNFYDAGMHLLDSLFRDPGDPRSIVHAARDLDGDGIAEVNSEIVEVELDRDQIDQISGCYYVIAKGKLNTRGFLPEDPNVRFYSYFYLHSFLSAIAELEMNSDDY